MSKKFYITDILPEPDQKELAERIHNAQGYIQENRMNYTNPEVMFIATLQYYIDNFEKAIKMVASDRFTVDFEPKDENNPIPSLLDFPIIPINHAKT